MTSKSFKGLLSANELNVVGYGDSSQVDLLIRRSDRAITSTGIAIAPSDAPALALAILEAAGVESPYYNLGDAVGNLRRHVEREARYATEAKEQAELEAEAFKLCRAYLEGRTGFDSWNELTDAERDHWLAVARKAREMRAEK